MNMSDKPKVTVLISTYNRPQYLAEAIESVVNQTYQDWELIWAFREPEKYCEMEQEPHTKVVRYRNGEYYRAYASAKFWVTNSRLPRELQPKEGQEYIQCWHGTPLKRLGYDLDHYAEKNGSLLEVQENYLEETKRVTHMPSPSEFYSEKIA